MAIKAQIYHQNLFQTLLQSGHHEKERFHEKNAQQNEHNELAER